VVFIKKRSFTVHDIDLRFEPAAFKGLAAQSTDLKIGAAPCFSCWERPCRLSRKPCSAQRCGSF
jgi:hypothetical protein